MVTDAIISWFFGVVGFILDLFPDVEVPSWLSAGGPLATVMTYAGSMGAWFPAQLVVTVLLGVLAAWGVAFGIKLIRIIASFFTAGGGSAA